MGENFSNSDFLFLFEWWFLPQTTLYGICLLLPQTKKVEPEFPPLCWNIWLCIRWRLLVSPLYEHDAAVSLLLVTRLQPLWSLSSSLHCCTGVPSAGRVIHQDCSLTWGPCAASTEATKGKFLHYSEMVQKAAFLILIYKKQNCTYF